MDNQTVTANDPDKPQKLSAAKKVLTFVISLSLVLNDIIGATNDFGWWLPLFFAAMFTILLPTALVYQRRGVASLEIPLIGKVLSKGLIDWWWKPMIGGLFAITFISAMANYAAEKTQSGILAELIPGISKIQENLGIINQQATDIKELTRSLKGDLDEIKEFVGKSPGEILMSAGYDPSSSYSFLEALKKYGRGMPENRFLMAYLTLGKNLNSITEDTVLGPFDPYGDLNPHITKDTRDLFYSIEGKEFPLLAYLVPVPSDYGGIEGVKRILQFYQKYDSSFDVNKVTRVIPAQPTLAKYYGFYPEKDIIVNRQMNKLFLAWNGEFITQNYSFGGLNIAHMLAMTGDIPLTKLFVEFGLDQFDVTAKNGATPMSFAVETLHFDYIDYLLNEQNYQLKSQDLLAAYLLPIRTLTTSFYNSERSYSGFMSGSKAVELNKIGLKLEKEASDTEVKEAHKVMRKIARSILAFIENKSHEDLYISHEEKEQFLKILKRY